MLPTRGDPKGVTDLMLPIKETLIFTELLKHPLVVLQISFDVNLKWLKGDISEKIRYKIIHFPKGRGKSKENK